MMDAMIPGLPLPLVSALVLSFLLACLLRRRDRRGLFIALVGACAMQAVVISLAHYYEIAAVRSLQPITAATIPPLAWAAFQFSETRKLHLDPDLTFTRLARVLQVPVKSPSIAVNRSTGDSVSRYVNGYRIREACRTMEWGARVTEAMLACGFNTKSNFNREFRRVTGKAPSTWRNTVVGESPLKSNRLSRA